MKKRRLEIPRQLEAELLFRNDHSCCICRQRGKDVQIHHINGNPTNNNPANLGVVCLDCHSRVTGPRGLGKAYSTDEVRRYKRDWEYVVAESRRIVRRPIRHAKELVSQIDLIVADILASEGDNSRQQRLLKQLYELHLWRGVAEIQKNIIDGVRHLGTMSGLGDPRLAPMVAETAWQMCWHLAGPDLVPWQKETTRLISGAIRAIGSIGTFNAYDVPDPKVGKAFSEAMLNLIHVGVGYRKRNVVERVLHEIQETLAAIAPQRRSQAVKTKAFVSHIRGTLRATEAVLKSSGSYWQHPLADVRRLLERVK